MRNELTVFLGERLQCEIAKHFPSARRIGEDEYFNGAVGIRIVSVGSRTFFVAALASENDDTFRVHFAWSDSADYPLEPCSDIRASLDDFMECASSEFQLAVLNPLVIPWSWDLDRAHADWHSEMTRLQGALQHGDPVLAAAFGRHLLAIPKRCPVGVAKKVAGDAAVEIAGYLNRFGRPLMFDTGARSGAYPC
ncbi:MAG TPA: hypothetical protein VFS41_01090 [Edaphobacter sp.]|nr:hypothetical protein [Edaphobacter sp.]